MTFTLIALAFHTHNSPFVLPLYAIYLPDFTLVFNFPLFVFFQVLTEFTLNGLQISIQFCVLLVIESLTLESRWAT